MLLRYPGSKAKLAEHIRHALPVSRAEMRIPFLGGGGLEIEVLTRPSEMRPWLDRVVPDSIWTNDLNPGVAALWTAVIQEPERLIDRILHYQPRVQDFYRIKKDLLAGTVRETVNLGFHFLVLNRISRDGRGVTADVPTNPVYQSWNPAGMVADVERLHRLLRSRVRENHCTSLDFEEVLGATGDYWAFIDPPYVEKGKALYQHNFKEEDHRRLADVLHRRGQPFLMTYDEHPLIRDLYGGWAVIEEFSRVYGDNRKVGTGLLIYPRYAADQVKDQREPLAWLLEDEPV